MDEVELFPSYLLMFITTTAYFEYFNSLKSTLDSTYALSKDKFMMDKVMY